ncbi:interferon-induced very large GTPase 1-like isoform X1 [Xenopus tropicalis]|uniref:Interferon-induced very large GTPase 1-like isoform X1 n=1 Tax=Xenopus tropicalis TaxID=8364 RepID=A0A8J1IY27_XENTR|nr:interferon-induced very large GTPase 1-like isoform X1 [Xenopus tropicalis]
MMELQYMQYVLSAFVIFCIYKLSSHWFNKKKRNPCAVEKGTIKGMEGPETAQDSVTAIGQEEEATGLSEEEEKGTIKGMEGPETAQDSVTAIGQEEAKDLSEKENKGTIKGMEGPATAQDSETAIGQEEEASGLSEEEEKGTIKGMEGPATAQDSVTAIGQEEAKDLSEKENKGTIKGMEGPATAQDSVTAIGQEEEATGLSEEEEKGTIKGMEGPATAQDSVTAIGQEEEATGLSEEEEKGTIKGMEGPATAQDSVTAIGQEEAKDLSEKENKGTIKGMEGPATAQDSVTAIGQEEEATGLSEEEEKGTIKGMEGPATAQDSVTAIGQEEEATGLSEEEEKGTIKGMEGPATAQDSVTAIGQEEAKDLSEKENKGTIKDMEGPATAQDSVTAIGQEEEATGLFEEEEKGTIKGMEGPATAQDSETAIGQEEEATGLSEEEEKENRNTLNEMIESYKESKLSLRDILDVGQENINEVAPQTVQDLPWALLRKLMALDRTARTIQLEDISENSGSDSDSVGEGEHFLQMDSMEDSDSTEKYVSQNLGFYSKEDKCNSINPLDSLCALLHCSDMLLQQNILSKMSLCQFAVPLLLPAGDGPECTFMLWAMRDIVKRWRPHTLADSKGFVEENLVQVEMPLLSFVRLGQSKLSKSKILNQVLSPAQQYQDFFVHENMEGGNIKREISDGLVEISWFLPAGRTNTDIFPEPVAVTNMRGDIESNWTQFRFLTQVSSAVFVFAESINERECELLAQCSKSNPNFYFIITPSGKGVSKETVKSLKKSSLHIGKSQILIKDKRANDARLVSNIQSIVKKFLEKNDKRVKLEDLSNTATELQFKVDENSQECQKAKTYAEEINKEIQDVVQYKKETMKLQGDLWKQVAQIEKELCRMRKQGDKNPEEYRSQLTKKLNKLHKEQNQHFLPDSMSKFISAITHLSQTEKHYFLKWMKFALDSVARNRLSMLKAKYKKTCNNKENNQDELKQLDQQLSDSSLGVEHFLREMGQFYEAECSMVSQGKIKPDNIQFCNLPGIAADLLLDGFPLELIDGDASNIPLQWVTDLLIELDKKTGGKCRMRVITVLGVQSTGKSTLLNTMFGLQFSVSSGRCTRGAFLTLIKVKKDFLKNLGCEFILVIDTEGLKAPELASLEGSYEHDNELATLVVGLSDITIINMAMENTAEMKDTLQIVVHAFLRMKQIGKKPNCQFVHQNVSDVSADDNNMRDRKKLLEQLDEMTRTAANMEKKNGFNSFTDIMSYNIERDNRYIPGLWYGVPPMASVSSGYSENVYELKKYLFEFMEKEESLQPPQNIPEFTEWIKSLWNSVKYENFIFSFRNSLVAEAYNQLAMKYSQWEWDFRKQVHTWLISTENSIKNQSADKLQPEMCSGFKDDLVSLLCKEEKNMLDLLKKYFESKTDNVHLIEKYREDFSKGVNFLRKELEHSVTAKIEEIIIIQKGKYQIKNIEDSYQKIIEKKVTNLLKQVRERESRLGDDDIEKEFENMWGSTIAELPKYFFKKFNVTKEMLLALKHDLSNKGSAIMEKILNIKCFDEFGKGEFQIKEQHVDMKWFSRIKEYWTNECHIKTDSLASCLIKKCSDYVTKKDNTGGDYDGTYCQELLNIINERLRDKDVKNLHINNQFDLDIKLHILGDAARRFQMMHERFLKTDPMLCLGTLKPHYFTTFKHLFQEKDETQSRAKQFCELCLKPAITKQIYEHLGKDIVDDILVNKGSKELSSRTFFQAHVLEKLLTDQDFSQYVAYINAYEGFVKKWLKQYILNTYEKGLEKLQTNILSDICKKIRSALKELQGPPTVSEFLKAFCEMLKSEIVISQMELQLVSFQNKADVKQFSKDIEFFLEETEKQISSEIGSSNTESVLAKLTMKPEEELFKKVFGCGKQCPFCGVPCEAGGTDHKEHFASVHRPQGLGRYRWTSSDKLAIELCSTHVVSDCRFSNSDTEWKPHPYKEYRKFYPDWAIQPDPSITASNYWKYIFKHFNKEFAEEYKAKPADLPVTWLLITKEQAMQSLKKIFNLK